MRFLAKQFVEFIRRKKSYRQARLIHHSGQEIVRVEHEKDSDRILRRLSDLPKKLPDNHPYVKDTLELDEGDVYLSKINLNMENGIKQSDFPVVRAATPVFIEPGKPFGLIVINMDFADLSKFVTSSKENSVVYLTNDEGEFLMHPTDEIAFSFERKIDYRIDDLYEELENFRLSTSRLNEPFKNLLPAPAVYIEPPQNRKKLKSIGKVVESLLEEHHDWKPAFKGDAESQVEQVLVGVPASQVREIEARIRDEVGEGYTVHVLPQDGFRGPTHIYCQKIQFDDRDKSRFICLVFVVPETE